MLCKKGRQKKSFMNTEKQSDLSKRWPALLALVVSVVAYSGMVGVHVLGGTLRANNTPYTLAWYGLAFVAFVAILVWSERQAGLSLRFIFGGAILFRILLWFTVPALSDDVFRYIWDGHVAINGVSPYAMAIDSEELDYLDIPLRALANNAAMASPYPPAAQYLFASLLWLFPPSTLVFQIAMTLLDLVNGFLLIKLLQIARLPQNRVLIYLWNPLVIIEVAHSAHVDIWMLCLTLIALWLTFMAQKPKVFLILSPIVFGLAILGKFLPILLLPLLFWRWRWWQMVLCGLVTIGLLIPPAMIAGWGLSGPMDGTGIFGALRIYEKYWRFNSGLFHWLELSFTNAGYHESGDIATNIIQSVMGIVSIGLWIRAYFVSASERTLLRLMALPFMTYVLLTPTLHPWYSLMLLAFLPFLPPTANESPWRWLSIVPWIYLSAALVLSYLTYLDPQNYQEVVWVRHVTWWPTWGLFLVWIIGTGIVWRNRPADFQ